MWDSGMYSSFSVSCYAAVHFSNITKEAELHEMHQVSVW